MDFKISLKAARVNANLSQNDVAKHMGKSKMTINHWENGKSAIDFGNFTALCLLYKINPEFVFMPMKST